MAARALTMSILVATFWLAGCAAPPPRLQGHTVAEWRQIIAPGKRDLAWMKIPWPPSFEEGIAASNQDQKPLLLWVMNGHPLGCT